MVSSHADLLGMLDPFLSDSGTILFYCNHARHAMGSFTFSHTDRYQCFCQLRVAASGAAQVREKLT